MKFSDVRPGDLVVTKEINIGRLAISVVSDDPDFGIHVAILWLVLWDKDCPGRAGHQHTTYYDVEEKMLEGLEVFRT